MTNKHQLTDASAKGQSKSSKAKYAGQETSQALATTEPKQMTLAEATDIINSKINTKDPKPEEVKLLRQAVKLFPEISQQIGNLAQLAKNRMIENISGNVVAQEAFRQRTEQLQIELGYERAPALEQLLIEQIVICWLAMYEMQQRYTSIRASGETMSIDQATWLEKRLTIAQTRYLKAIESLARVRRLSKPSIAQTVMLNVAKQQINAALGNG